MKSHGQRVGASLLVTLVWLLFPAAAGANAGGPILLMINMLLFSFGQIWIVFSETVYLKRLHKEQTIKEVVKVVALMNLSSTLAGALLFPFLLALVGIAGAFLTGLPATKPLGEYLFALGTWVVGDNSPHAGIALTAAAIGFVVTYFLTVWIEFRYLERKNASSTFPPTSLKHCYLLNGISYAGLVLLFSFSNFF